MGVSETALVRAPVADVSGDARRRRFAHLRVHGHGLEGALHRGLLHGARVGVQFGRVAGIETGGFTVLGLAEDGVASLERWAPVAPPPAEALPIDALERSPAAPDVRTDRGVQELPYAEDHRALLVTVAVDGEELTSDLEMIFDTGATFTTLSWAAMDTLEIHVPRDAPMAKLQTANGQIEAPLALVDAVWLGEEVVEWVMDIKGKELRFIRL